MLTTIHSNILHSCFDQILSEIRNIFYIIFFYVSQLNLYREMRNMEEFLFSLLNWTGWSLVPCYNLSVEWHSLFSWQLGLVKLSVKWLHFVITVWNIQIIFISRSLKIKLFCQQHFKWWQKQTQPTINIQQRTLFNFIFLSPLLLSQNKSLKRLVGGWSWKCSQTL